MRRRALAPTCIAVRALREVGAPVRYTEYPGVEHDAWDPASAEPELMRWFLSHTLGA